MNTTTTAPRTSARTGLEVIDAVVYATPQGGTVTLTPNPDGGWLVTDTNTNTAHEFTSIPAFMAYCRANYSWPMASSTAV